GPFSFEGPLHTYNDITLSVRPLQRPYPPMWMPSRDPAVLAELADEGVNTGSLLFVPRSVSGPRYREYRRRWKAAGHAEGPLISYFTLVHVDETDDLALERAAPHMVHTFTDV